MTKRIFALCLILAMALPFASCGKKDTGPATKLSFQATAGYDYLKTLDGTRVTINGYMATSSPVDGSFLFLMNLPYQSCPFCVPNTSQLSNTIEVYPKKGSAFTYTSQAISVTGTLEVAPDPNKPFTDQYGYEFNFKIVDAEYTIVQADDLSQEMALWQKIAEADVVTDIYGMYDYASFLCAWNTYYVNNSTDADGNAVPGYFLYPTDAVNLLQREDGQYHYGYKDGYFDGIVKKIENVDASAFSDLVSNVRAVEALCQKALAELENGNYTSEEKYLEQFGTNDLVYTLNMGEELKAEMQTLYSQFANWLASWEL